MKSPWQDLRNDNADIASPVRDRDGPVFPQTVATLPTRPSASPRSISPALR